jgi:hypothetical protein
LPGRLDRRQRGQRSPGLARNVVSATGEQLVRRLGVLGRLQLLHGIPHAILDNRHLNERSPDLRDALRLRCCRLRLRLRGVYLLIECRELGLVVAGRNL